MKTSSILPLTALLFASCAAPGGMTIKQYESLTQPAGKAAALGGLQLSIEAPGKPATRFETAALRPELRWDTGRDFIYPTAYEPARSGTRSDPGAVIPATPDKFSVTQIGVKADLKSERRGELVILKGEIKVTDFQGFTKMGGELGQPILDEKGRVVTENQVQMPKLATFTTPVYVAVKPGKPCSFEIAHPVKGAKAVINIAAGS